MEYTIHQLEEKNWKSLMLTLDRMLVSSKKYADSQTFEEKFGEKSMLESKNEIPLSSINKLSREEKSNIVTFHYNNENNKETSIAYTFENISSVAEVSDHFTEKLKFKKEKVQQSAISAVIFPAILALVGILGTWLFASQASSGESMVSESGVRRNRGIKMILGNILDSLGTTGIIVVGSLITAYLIYSAYKTYKNPPFDLVYTR
jgi:hypothetical protein